MTGERSRYGLLVSALGAVLLAVAVFVPWYGVSLTPAGVAQAQHAGEQVAQQFGNAQLQSIMSGLQQHFAALTGHEVGALSAHQVLHVLGVVLLALAGFALLDSLVPLAHVAAPLPHGAGRAVVPIGIVAALCVLFRMLDRPTPEGGVLSLSLREGAWLALLGALMVALGGIWPRSTIVRSAVEGPVGGDPFAALSGSTLGR